MAIFFRRLAIMVIALITPELMVTWATIQFLSALDTAKAFNAIFNPQQSSSERSNVQERTAMLTSDTLALNGKSGPHPPAGASRGNFRGRLPARPFGTVANFVKWMSHRVDRDARVFLVDGRIHALLR